MPIHPPLQVVRVKRRHETSLKLKFHQSELGPAEIEEKEEVAPPLIWSQRSRGPALSEGIEIAEAPQSKAPSVSLITSDEGAET